MNGTNDALGIIRRLKGIYISIHVVFCLGSKRPCDDALRRGSSGCNSVYTPENKRYLIDINENHE